MNVKEREELEEYLRYKDRSERISSTSEWEQKFSTEELRAFYRQSRVILEMNEGKERRQKLLELLEKGFRIRLNYTWGGSWRSDDRDIKYLLKKGKIKTFKQYQHSALNDHYSHTFAGIC